jgi:hypothetical protein
VETKEQTGPEEYLLAYIAHCGGKSNKDILTLQSEMTQRGFPTIRSEQVDETYVAPKEIAENRVHCLSNWRNRFFFLFIDVSANDPVALVEFGYALNHTENVCLIGKSRTNSFQYHSKVQLFDSVENFLVCHFPN